MVHSTQHGKTVRSVTVKCLAFVFITCMNMMKLGGLVLLSEYSLHPGVMCVMGNVESSSLISLEKKNLHMSGVSHQVRSVTAIYRIVHTCMMLGGLVLLSAYSLHQGAMCMFGNMEISSLLSCKRDDL